MSIVLELRNPVLKYQIFGLVYYQTIEWYFSYIQEGPDDEAS